MAVAQRIYAEALFGAAKDAVRLPPALAAQVSVAGIGIAWEDPAAIDALLSRLFPV